MKGDIKFDNKNCKITTEKIIYYQSIYPIFKI